MKASIISIGNELLIGDTVNTNAAWLGRYLTEKGFQVENILSVPDDYSVIMNAVSRAMEKPGIVITTGGLGPTHDDITKKVIADLFDSQLVLNEDVLIQIKDRFKRRSIPFTKSNHDQALVPKKSRVLQNEKGTAPGLWLQREMASVVVLPGVPNEMKWLMENPVKDILEEVYGKLSDVTTKYIHTAGIGESSLSDDIIGDLEEFLKNGNQVAYLPGPTGVTLRLTSRSSTNSNLNLLTNHIYQKAGDFIVGEGRDVSIEKITGQYLREQKLTISTAESCTGGLLSSRITDVPGSGDYMLGGVVVYADRIKTSILDVPEETITGSGAVSQQTAMLLAKNVSDLFGSDIGVSTTGIAGPGGGSEEKPVGLVWMGFSLPDTHFALKVNLTKDRLLNKEMTVTIVLETLRRRLLGLQSFPYDLKPHFT